MNIKLRIRAFAAAALVSGLALSQAAYASMTARYENKDSKTYFAEAICSGSKQSPVEFRGSTTSSVSIQGSTPCTISLNGKTYVWNSDVKIVIKDGNITAQ